MVLFQFEEMLLMQFFIQIGVQNEEKYILKSVNFLYRDLY